MSSPRNLGPTPDGYFPPLHQTMEEAGLGELKFGFDITTGDFDRFQALGPFTGSTIGEDFLSTSEHDGMSIGAGIEREGLTPKIQYIAQTAMRLNPLIIPKSPRAREYPYVHGLVKVNDIFRSHGLVKPIVTWHTDGRAEDRDFVVVSACDNLGTLRRSRIPGFRAHMPINTMIEFEPDFEHAEPITRSRIPIPRTFVRLTYSRPPSR